MREHIEDAVFARVCEIETVHSGMNFGMDENDVDEMIFEGFQAVDKWLASQT
jgi:hypothetical protein